MTHGFALQLGSARIVDADLFILAGGNQLRAIPVEAGAVNDVRMGVDVHEDFTSAHVPNHDLVIGAGGKQHVERRGMPQHQTHATLVENQVDHGFGECSRQPAIGDLPHFDHTVL